MEITARTDGGLRVEAAAGATQAAMDEPVEQGGGGTAPTPVQTLLAALGGCTAMTLKLYSARKQWPLEDVTVRVHMQPPPKDAADSVRRFTQEVVLKGALDQAQRERLQQIAGRCPVHRILEGPNAFEERLVEALDAEG